ncbi:MAG: VOC family protein [Bacteroidetes bacterium]|nr:VOC family protein [Bacteroidota bacterium]
MNPVVHFELPADDRVRMAEFYTSVFGWQANMLGEEMGNYVTVATAETDENGQSKIPGTINGGLYQRNPEMGATSPSVVIAVDNIYEKAKELAAAGGKVLGEPTEIPGVGLFVGFVDTEGNHLSLLQPKMG